MSDKITESLKAVLLAGVGAAVVTAEKSKELIDELVKRGELTMEQGKVLNEELKHSIKAKYNEAKEKYAADKKKLTVTEITDSFDSLTDEEIAEIKARIDERGK